MVRRRGSILVIVVGTLALLAVLMLVYVSVGRQDARTKAAASTRERLDDVPQQFADYLADQIIAADALATYYDDGIRTRSARAGVPDDEPVLIREAFDYGSTDWTRRSDTLDRLTAFNPVGTYVRVRDPSLGLPSRGDPGPAYSGVLPLRMEPSDPWLASNEPTWLAFAPAGNDFSQSPLDALVLETASAKKDWLHISNVAPDGKFVNLFNLAPSLTPDGPRLPNLGARPGFGTFETDFGLLPRLSQGLSLLSAPDNRSDADRVQSVTAWSVPVSDTDRVRPAFWDSWQRGAFRLAEENRPGIDGGSASYLPYQWADADGDGMFDSRWMEWTDSRIFDLTGDPSGVLNLLETDGKYRYFFATRIIDASGMINVNTATDQAAAPTATNPVGLTPADVDLRRLLTLHDQYDGFRANPSAYVDGGPLVGRSGAGYDGILHLPLPVGRIPGLTPGDYRPVSPDALPAPVDQTSALSGYNLIRAYTTGSMAYTALRLSLSAGRNIPLAAATATGTDGEYRGMALFAQFAPTAFFNPDADARDVKDPRDRRFARRFWDFVPGPDAATPGAIDDGLKVFPTVARLPGGSTNLVDVHAPPPAIPALLEFDGFYPSLPRRRSEHYARQARAELGSETEFVLDNNNQIVSRFRATGSFGIEDLSELLTYRASNDITVLSSLERVLGGRDRLPFDLPVTEVGEGTPDPRRFDPLRSNRGPEVELARDLYSRQPGELRDAETDQPTPDGRADARALLQLDADIRQRLTTVSGARSIFAGIGPDGGGVSFDSLDAAELKTNATSLLSTYLENPAASQRVAAKNALFGTYANALLPYSNRVETWQRPRDSETRQFSQYKTLSYGHDGSAPALLAAAHMAANLGDLADADTTSTSWTVLLNRGEAPLVNALDNSPREFPSWREGRRLDLGEVSPQRLPVQAARDQRVAPALTVYGIEPQPFVTAVATFTVYTDKNPPEEGNVDFRSDLTVQNPEFLYRVLAFRLHNPFGVDVTLGDASGAIAESSPFSTPQQAAATRQFMRDVDLGDGAMYELDRQRDFYYIKFGGRTFLLTGIEERVRHQTESDTRLNRGQYLPSPGGGGWDIAAATSYDPRTERRRGAPLTIKAGGTVVAYALTQMPRHIPARIGRANFSQGAPRDEVRQLIERQLRLNWASETQCVWIPEIDAGRVPVVQNAPDLSTGQLGTLDQRDQRCNGGRYNQGFFKAWRTEQTAMGQLLQPHPRATPIDPEFINRPEDDCDRRLLDNTEVQLWRAVRSTGPSEIDSDNRIEQTPRALPTSLWDGASPVADEQPAAEVSVYVRNRYENDQLIDRLRVPLKKPGGDSPIPSYVDLDARLKPVGGSNQIEVEGTEDDTFRDGLTLALWAAVRRPQDPSLENGGVVPAGAIAAFGLEAKPPEDLSDLTDANWERFQWNRYVKQRLDWKEPDSGDFEGDDRSHGAATALRLAQWVRRWSTDSDPGETAPGVNSVVCRAIATSAVEPLPLALWAEESPQGLELSRLLPVAVEGAYGALHAHALAGNAAAAAAERRVAGSNPVRFDPVEIERFTSTFFVRDGRADSGGEPPRSTLRVADLLLPMGIGPIEAPWTISGQPNTDLNARWTTLSEAIVASMWDWNEDPSQPSNDPSKLSRPIETVGGKKPKFDRGQLRLDDFAPFFNTNGDSTGRFEPGQGDPQVDDLRFFTKVPLALNVLDMFSAGVAGDESVTRGVPGLININTAPLAVARCLPMLSPLTRAGRSEVQTITVRPPTSIQAPPPPGQQNDQWRPWPPPFTLTLTRGATQETTRDEIPVGASPAVVQAALEAMEIVGRGNVSVTAGSPLNPGQGWDASLEPYRGAHYVVTFTGALSMLDLDPLELRFVGAANPADPDSVKTAVNGSNVRLGPGWWGEGSGIDQSVDLAATLVANRDKIEVPLRAQSRQLYNLAAGGGSIPVQSVRYLHIDSQGVAANPATPPDQVVTRARETDIPAISETPGFQSLGALMTLRYRGNNLAFSSGQPYDYAKSMRTSIDYMGYPTNPLSIATTGFQADNQSLIGVDSVLGGSLLPTQRSDFLNPDDPAFRRRTLYPGDFVGTDDMPNEYKEKLAIANAVVNTTTTRSDYFIAWFLVHGYQQSDVENLAPDDVMTPTIARRFVMVVDRSNVVKRGDKPRVLLFKEVPVSGR